MGPPVEYLRLAARRVLGDRSNLYRLAARTTDQYCCIRSEGLQVWRRLEALRNADQTIHRSSGELIPLSKLMHAIRVRAGTRDAESVISTIIREEYGQMDLSSEPTTIVDAGAYIGDSAAYFLSRFKNVRMIAIEPSVESFQVAQENLRPYGNRLTLLNEALAGVPGERLLSGGSTMASLADSGAPVHCTSIPELINRFSLTSIDILKMDVEGAEMEIFTTQPLDWLKLVKNILVEIHWQQAVDTIVPLLTSHGFTVRRFRTVHYATRG